MPPEISLLNTQGVLRRLASSDVLLPKSGRPLASLPDVTLVARRGEVGTVENVEQLRDELQLVRVRDPQELQEPQVDVGEARAIHRRHFSQPRPLRKVFTAPTSSDRHPDPGATPTGKSPV